MRDSDRPRFAAAFATLCEGFGVEASEPKAEFYWEGLRDMPVERIENAIRMSAKKSERMPAPAELRRLGGKVDVQVPYHLPLPPIGKPPEPWPENYVPIFARPGAPRAIAPPRIHGGSCAFHEVVENAAAVAAEHDRRCLKCVEVREKALDAAYERAGQMRPTQSLGAPNGIGALVGQVLRAVEGKAGSA